MRKDTIKGESRIQTYRKHRKKQMTMRVVVSVLLAFVLFISIGMYRMFFGNKKTEGPLDLKPPISEREEDTGTTLQVAEEDAGDNQPENGETTESASADMSADNIIADSSNEGQTLFEKEKEVEVDTNNQEFSDLNITDSKGFEDSDNHEDGDEKEEVGSISDTEREPEFVKMAATMSLVQKASQLILPRPEAFDTPTPDQLTYYLDENIKSKMKNEPSCGVVLSEKTARNVSYDNFKLFTEDLFAFSQRELPMPFFIMIYEKIGSPSWSVYLQANSVDNARSKGSGVSGELLNEYGINLSYLDAFDIEIENNIINYSDNNVMACAGKFPKEDNDIRDADEDIKILKQMVEDGVSIVMVSDQLVSGSEEGTVPALVSKSYVSDVIRDKERGAGFEGVVMTDAMDFIPPKNMNSYEEAIVKALQAGVDVILLPPNYSSAVEAIVEAIEKGELTESRIDESLYRIYKLKQNLEGY